MFQLKLNEKCRKIIRPLVIIIVILLVVRLLFAFIHLMANLEQAGKLDGKLKFGSETGMTSAQRLEDFDYLCSYLEKNMASLYDYEEVYGISFETIKNKYTALILEADSDFDYFTLLLAFFMDIPSVHTNICYPQKASYTGGYNGSDILNKSGINPATDYWSSVIERECKKYSDVSYKTVSYNYNSGIYDSTITGTTMDMGASGYTELLSVDGISVDEYVKSCTSFFKICYDFYNDKAYRDCLIFNDSFGEKHTIKYTDAGGKIFTKEVYGGVQSEYITILISSLSADNNETAGAEATELNLNADEIKCSSFYAYRDVENNVAYIYISDFLNHDGSRLRETITNMFDMDNIIIDLRSNGGGYSQYLELNVFPVLFDGIFSDTFTMHFKDTKENRKVKYYAKEYCTNFGKSSIDGLRSFDETLEMKGEAKKQRNIYLLVSGSTASAADEFTALVKYNALGTIIGTNTHGEANCSFITACLPTSKIVFRYTPVKYYNKDGTLNNVYGTTPDIYSTVSSDSYRKMKNLGKEAYNYENQKKWDDVLITTLEIINEKESAK